MTSLDEMPDADPMPRLPLTLSERFEAFPYFSSLALAAPIPERTVEIVPAVAPLPAEKIIEVMLKRTEPDFVLTMPVEQKSHAFIHPDRLPLVQSASPGLDEERKDTSFASMSIQLPQPGQPLPKGWRLTRNGYPVRRRTTHHGSTNNEFARSSPFSTTPPFIPRGMRLTPAGRLVSKHRAGKRNRAKVCEREQMQALSVAKSAAAAITRRLENAERQVKERREERVHRERRSVSPHRPRHDGEKEHRVVIRGDMWRGPALQLADTIYAMEGEYKCRIVHQHTLSQNTDGKCVISIFADDNEVCKVVATTILRLAFLPGLA